MMDAPSLKHPEPGRHRGESLVFVIPVRHPDGKKVHDYKTIETLLHSTVRSLLNQTHENVAVVVVGHRKPDWVDRLDDRFRFLDISNEASFGCDQYHVTIDKGLKYCIGVLYAMVNVDPKLIMLMDADDFVHVELAGRLLVDQTRSSDCDGYIVRKGVHTGVHVDIDYRVGFRFAVVVDEFDYSCGSCRIFDAKRLANRILAIDPAIGDRFSVLRGSDEQKTVRVPEDLTGWLARTTEDVREEEAHIVNLLGRHTKQPGYFNFQVLDFLGAAKGCGHGNHDGPRRGAVHWLRVVRRMPLNEFLRTFGLPAQRWSFDFLAMVRARLADKRAGNVWADG